jgi:hypothetical protein
MLNVILRQGYLSLKEINPNPIIPLARSVKFEDSTTIIPYLMMWHLEYSTNIKALELYNKLYNEMI